ncbi:MAG: hypothetical protein FWE32_00750 [Oscillospiraceae bacterium]|nr:hypothetical protein [Oscillospiraceae bacterium]
MSEKSVHSGHRRRVKEEFQKLGLGHFPPHKVLEMLLFYTIPRGDTNEIAHRLIERFGSLAAVLDAPVELLKRVPGVGVESATHIRLCGDLVRLYIESTGPGAGGKAIKTVAGAKDAVRHKFLGENRECVQMVCLSSGGKILYSERIIEGSHKRVEVLPATVIRLALLCDAAKVLLAHNHPGGLCNPSREDLYTTKCLYNELNRVGIELMDHLIVAEGDVFSMAENNMLE